MSEAIAWQKEQFSKPYELFDIRAVDQKQKELGRVLTLEEFDAYVFDYQTFGENDK